MSSHPQANRSITAVILAGGLGRRMGGADKGLIAFQGQPLVAHVVARIAPQVERIVISANRSLDSYRQLGFPVISDTFPDFAGPLAGVASALAHCSDPLLLTVPCDTPLLPGDLVERLHTALDTHAAAIAIPHDGVQLQAAIMLMRREVEADLQSYLLSGERRVQSWLERQKIVTVDFSDERACFVNLNTLQELQTLEQYRDH